MPYREQSDPERLKQFDVVFEMDLPLDIAQVDFESDVIFFVNQTNEHFRPSEYFISVQVVFI